MIRQGDVLLLAIDTIPADATAVPRDTHNRLVLAKGEATGHAHVIRAKSAQLFEQGAFMYLRAPRPVTLYHEEHTNIPLKPGTYKIIRQREYTPTRERRVED